MFSRLNASGDRTGSRSDPSARRSMSASNCSGVVTPGSSQSAPPSMRDVRYASTDTPWAAAPSIIRCSISGFSSRVTVILEEILAPRVVGRDPALVRQIHEDLLRETEYGGSAGLAMFGIAAIDTALWDLLGQAAGMPVHRLLGAARDRIPAYAMVGWLNYDEDELTSTCERAVEQGFRAVKVKVGAPTLEDDMRRLAA